MKGVELSRGRGSVSAARETQLFLRRNQSNRVDCTDILICGHELLWDQDVPGCLYFLICVIDSIKGFSQCRG